MGIKETILNEIEVAFSIVGGDVRKLPSNVAEELWRTVVSFTDPQAAGSFIWERFRNDLSFFAPDGRALMALGALDCSPVLLVKLVVNEPHAWEFKDQSRLVSALENSTDAEEDYIMDGAKTWVLAINHHGFLIGAGRDAVSFVRRLQEQDRA